MVKTRRMSKSIRRRYRQGTRSSPCRGKGPAVCRSKPGCKYSSGKRRSFCRKKKNTKRRKGGSRTKKRGGNRKKRGKGIFSQAIVPFGLWGAKSAYSRRK